MGLFNALFGCFSRKKGASSHSDRRRIDTDSQDLLSSPGRRFPTHESLVVHLLNLFDKDSHEFITFTDESRPDRFVQVVYGENTDLNFHYPFTDDPRERFKVTGFFFPESFDLFDWEEETYAMYNGDRIEPELVAELVQRLFIQLLGSPSAFTMTGTID